jgi:Domain of unknown function (DUF4271)
MFLVVPITRPAENLFQDWMFIFFAVGLGFLAFYYAFYFSKIRNVFRAFRSDVFLRQLMREENITPRSHFFLALLHAGLFSLLFVFSLVHFFQIQYPTWGLFLIAWLGVLCMYGLKWLTLQLTQWLIDGDFTLTEYAYRTFALNRLMSLLLFPLMSILALMDIRSLSGGLITVWCLVFLAVVWRIFKGGWVAFQSRVPLFYIFFYICTFEILPILLGVKFFTNHITH